MPKPTLEVAVSEALLTEIEELRSAIRSLIPLFVYDGLCQQCGGRDEHEEWCLVGQAEEKLK
jgi:hypothetical protein